MKRELIDLVENAAKSRNEPPVPQQYIAEALRRIETGKEEVARYPTGSPSLKAVYDLATRLADESAAKN